MTLVLVNVVGGENNIYFCLQTGSTFSILDAKHDEERLVNGVAKTLHILPFTWTVNELVQGREPETPSFEAACGPHLRIVLERLGFYLMGNLSSLDDVCNRGCLGNFLKAYVPQYRPSEEDHSFRPVSLVDIELPEEEWPFLVQRALWHAWHSNF